MKKCFISFILACLAILNIQAQDTTFLALKTIEAKAGGQQVTITLMAQHAIPTDLAAMQGIVKSPAWLELTDLTPLKINNEKDSDKMSFLGVSRNTDDYNNRLMAFFATAKTVATTGLVPMAKFTFTVKPGHTLVNEETFEIGLDSIKISSFDAQLIRCNSPLSLLVTVGKIDTIPIDTTTHPDTTNQRYQIKVSLKKTNADESYDLQAGQARLAVDLKYQAIISQLQFDCLLPDSTWTITSVDLTDAEKKVYFNKAEASKYSVIYMGDKIEHPLLPDPNVPEKTIMYLNLKKTDTPFGNQEFTVKNITAGSIYEEEDLVANIDTAVEINLNNLFGIKLGKKGDLQFADWQFGDGRLDSNDIELMSKILIAETTPNDYQRWAADVTNDNRVDYEDLTRLQYLVKISAVEELVSNSNVKIIQLAKELSCQNPDNKNLQLEIYSVNGSLLAKSFGFNPIINLTGWSSGLYFYICEIDNKQIITGKILI